MIGTALGPALFLVALAADVSAPKVTPSAFRDWFAAARAGRLEIPRPALDTAKTYQYVFVGGFWNETARGYFLQNAQDLAARGVPEAQIQFLFPSSDATLDENAAFVKAELTRFARSRSEPLVIVGHSRGACDALAFAVRNPEFARRRVAALFLLQGPFGGSAAADYVLHTGPGLTDGKALGLRHRMVASTIARFERNQLSKGNHGGLTDLARDTARQFWTDLIDAHKEAILDIAPRVYFLTTTTAPRRRVPFQEATARFIEAHDGPNDGLVAQADQWIAGLGTLISLPDVGHTDLTNRFPVGRPVRRLRTALVDAIVMTLATTAAPEPSPRPVATGRRPAPRRNGRPG